MKYEIWSEGFRATGETATATFHGEIEAPSFKEACDKHFKDDSYYHEEYGTYWGCKLWSNESYARIRFG